jgi:transglutaminase-like putative cysteine protease
MRYFIILAMFCSFAGCSDSGREARAADHWVRLSAWAGERARTLYEKSLARLKEGVGRDATAVKLARLYLERGDLDRVIALLRSVETPEARRLTAQAFFRRGETALALQAFEKAGPGGPAAYVYEKGLAFEKNNLYDKALENYASLEKDPAWRDRALARRRSIEMSHGVGAYAGVDEEVQALIRACPSEEAYPDASVLILLADETIRLTSENTLISTSHVVVKILNERGKEAYGEVSLSYDATYEKLEILVARTIKPDGTVVTVGDKNIRDVSLYMDYPMYSNVRARVISMPEIAPGAVIEYTARVTQTQLPNKKDFDTTYWLQADEPILWQRARISVPKDRLLRHKLVNEAYNVAGEAFAARTSEEGDEQVVTIDVKNVPQIVPEPSMPSEAQINAYFLFSTFSSWEDIFRWWTGLMEDKLVLNDDVRNKVAELTRHSKTPRDKASAIYGFVAQEIRYVAVEYGAAGYEPHRATDVFDNKYGDCKDQAILLVAMLRAAGLEATPVLVSTWGNLVVQKDLPGLNFDHAIAVVRLPEEGLVFMDPTASTVGFGDLPAADQGCEVMVFFKDHYEFLKTPVFEPSHNKSRVVMDMIIGEDGSLNAKRSLETQGSCRSSQRYWLRYTMPSMIEETLKARARDFADNATLLSTSIHGVEDLEAPISLSYEFEAPRFFVEAGSSRIMPQLGGLDTGVVVKMTRRTPVAFALLEEQEEVVSVEFPRSFAVKYIPPPVVVDNAWFRLEQVYRKAGSQRIEFTARRINKTREVSVADYAAFKAAIESAADSINQNVLFETRTRRSDVRS